MPPWTQLVVTVELSFLYHTCVTHGRVYADLCITGLYLGRLMLQLENALSYCISLPYFRTSDQARIPAEFKHIIKRRKRN